MSPDPAAERLLRAEGVMIRVRWAALVFAFVQIFTYYRPYPAGVRNLSIGCAVLLGVGNLALWQFHRRVRQRSDALRLGLASLALDVVVVTAFVFAYTFDPETAIWALIYILPLEGAILFQRPGALWTMTIATVLYFAREIYGTVAYDNDFLPTSISFRMGIGFIVAAVGGSMASNLVAERAEIERQADALRESEERFRRVFEAGAIGIAVITMKGTIVDANEAFARLLGTAPEALRDRPLMGLVHPDDTHVDEQQRADLLAGRIRAYRTELRFRRADAAMVWMNVVTSLIRGRGGEPRYGLTMLEDITDRRRADEHMREALRREQAATENLRQTDTFKTALLSAVSHDLRTPLTVIMGFAEQLSRELQDSSGDERMMIERIISNAQRLQRLIENLLDVDRLSRGSVRPKLEQTDLQTVVHAMIESMQIPGRPVELHTKPAEAPVDVALIERILENLVMNVMRHTPPNSPITIRTWQSDHEVTLAVEDRGPSVADELKKKIFEPFERGPEGHSPGTGVGLSLVHRFAELHGGRAWVEDRPGGGASFRVALPRRPAVTPAYPRR